MEDIADLVASYDAVRGDTTKLSATFLSNLLKELRKSKVRARGLRAENQRLELIIFTVYLFGINMRIPHKIDECALPITFSCTLPLAAFRVQMVISCVGQI